MNTFSKDRSPEQDPEYSPEDLSRIIEMAWEDRTPFEAIENLYGLNQHQLIELMRKELKRSSFELWRKRTTGRTTKHLKLRSPEINRGYCPSQYKR
ncbi:TIGR03643 family protein [Rheinheimera faecalis]|uniref:TIGR03643 family protein n=1 Tax=Rheinheimera faecalis TaxID=2901141 RepID=UPI001E34351C